jgi:hypothetical protein
MNPDVGQVQPPAEVAWSDPSRRQLWMAALKPPMYSVAIMPIWVGSAIAYAQSGVLDLGVFGGVLGSCHLHLGLGQPQQRRVRCPDRGG